MDAWLIIRQAPSVWVCNLGDPGALGDEPRELLINRMRVATGFPPVDDWLSDAATRSVAMTFGEPHPTLMAAATVLTVDDLTKVDPAAVAAHAQARAEAARQAQIDAAQTVLAQLHPDDLAAVVAAAQAPGKVTP